MCVLLPAQASASVTIGSTLPPVPGANTGWNGASSTETVFNQTLAAASTAPGGLTAPNYGVITRFRIETTLANGVTLFVTDPVRLRTMLDQGAAHFLMVSTEASTHPVADASAIQQFNTRLPIQAGEGLALDAVASMAPSHFYAAAANAGSTARNVSPRVSDGTSTSATQQSNQRVLLNADVEADADHDGYGDETQDLCPTTSAIQTACPTTPLTSPVQARKRKCKKAKKHSGRAAKKCKRKKRK
jgi:hypothetical protein